MGDRSYYKTLYNIVHLYSLVMIPYGDKTTDGEVVALNEKGVTVRTACGDKFKEWKYILKVYE